MRYRRVGRSGLRVSAVGLGSWLTYGGGYVDVASAAACVRRALELGVNFFDTADSYGDGAAERFLGRELRGVPRESYVLASKVFFPVGGGGPNESGLSRKHVIEGCHASLRRLRTDHLDVFFCHRPDPETPLEETLAALDDLVTQGKVLYVGVSDWPAELLAEAVELQGARGFDPVLAHSPEYSLLDRAPERGLLERCRELGVGVLSYQPLAQGVLAGRYAAGEEPAVGSRAGRREEGVWVRELTDGRTLERVGRLRELAAELDLTAAQLAIAWTLRDEVVAAVITGASRPDQLAENAAAGEVDLPAAALAELDGCLRFRDRVDHVANRGLQVGVFGHLLGEVPPEAAEDAERVAGRRGVVMGGELVPGGQRVSPVERPPDPRGVFRPVVELAEPDLLCGELGVEGVPSPGRRRSPSASPRRTARAGRRRCLRAPIWRVRPAAS